MHRVIWEEQLRREKQQKAVQEREPSTATPPPVPDWLKIWMENYRGQRWGFVAFYNTTTTKLKDPSTLQDFQAQVRKVAEIPFDVALEQGQPVDEINEARRTFEIFWAEVNDGEDHTKNDDLLTRLRVDYEIIKNHEDTPPGLAMPMFLYASPGAVASVLSIPPSVGDSGEASLKTTNGYWRPVAPFLVAVTEIDWLKEVNEEEDEDVVTGAGENGWYKPEFKVAIEVLVEELWWVLERQITAIWKLTRWVRRAELNDETSETGRGDKGAIVKSKEKRPENAHNDKPAGNNETAFGEDGLLDMWWTVHIPPHQLRKRRKLIDDEQ